MSTWQKYGKAFIGAAFFLWTVIAPLLSGDKHIDRNEWIIIGLGAGNALLVYIVPLNPSWSAGKTVINAVMASLAAAQTVIVDGLQPDDWTIIIGAGLALLIGWYAPAVSLPQRPAGTRVEVDSGFTA
jgi:hypothetical protein